MFSSVVFLLITLAVVGDAPGASTDGLLLDDPPLVMTPKCPPTEADRDRVHSLALFAESRLLYQRDQRATALRRLQRAWRYSPDNVSLLPEIVFLAHELDRRDELVRYALIAAEKTRLNPLLLRQLALQLSSQQAWEQALTLYEQAWLDVVPSAPGALDVSALLLSYEMGRLYFLIEDYEKSAESFARVEPAMDDPEVFSDHPALRRLILGEADRTYQLMAESCLLANQLDRAEKLFQKAYEVQPDDGLLAYNLARITAKREQPAQSIKYLDQYFALKCRDAGERPYRLLREQLQASSNDQAAIDDQLISRLEALREADPENSALLRFLAGCYRQAERWDQAEALLIELRGDEPNLSIDQELTEIYWQQRKVEPLLKVLRDVAQHTGLIRSLGETLEELATDQAFVDELLAVATDQLNAKAAEANGVAMAAAWLALLNGDYSAAEKWFAQALPEAAEERRGGLLLSWGLDLLLADQYEEAAQVFQQALDTGQLEERLDVCYYYLVRAQALGGAKEKAIKTAREAAKRSDSLEARTLYPWALYYAERDRAALEAYERLLQQFDQDYQSPGVRDEMRSTRMILSALAVRLGMHEQAQEWLEQVLDEFPGDIGASNDLGYLWADEGRHLQRALAMIQRAVDADPDNGAYRDSLGWVYYRLGRFAEAVKQLEAAVDTEEPDAVILEHLADAYLEIGDPEQAVATWKRALETLGPGDQLRDRLVEKIGKCER